MPKFKTPAEGFNGVVAGVTFTDGVGDTDDEGAIAYFNRHGYEPADKAPAKSAPKGNAKAEPKPADKAPVKSADEATE